MFFYLSVPWDTDLALVAGHHQDESGGNKNHGINIIPAKLPADEWLHSDLIEQTEKEGVCYGFPLHFSCWILVRRFIGPQAEMNFDSFVTTLLKRLRISPGDVFNRYRNPGELPISILAFDMHLLNDKINCEWIF